MFPRVLRSGLRHLHACQRIAEVSPRSPPTARVLAGRMVQYRAGHRLRHISEPVIAPWDHCARPERQCLCPRRPATSRTGSSVRSWGSLAIAACLRRFGRGVVTGVRRLSVCPRPGVGGHFRRAWRRDVTREPARSRHRVRRCTRRWSGPGPGLDEGGSSCRRSGRRQARAGSTLRAAASTGSGT